MELKDQDRIAMNRALRAILIEASDDELQEAFADTGEDLEALAARGEAIAQRAIHETCGAAQDLHRSLGALLRMLRRRDRLSLDDVARNARVAASELRSIELYPEFDPNPRTIFQLAQYFNVPTKSLVALSGAVHVTEEVREEAVRFAASSGDIAELTTEERKQLIQFVSFLKDHTDQ